ncbi:MAG: nodulation protein NfeD [Candidatus Sumerlaeota bacterium]|nr:nodulation protein NfeD [Candidatus Sumerlaeota bacterium]
MQRPMWFGFLAAVLTGAASTALGQAPHVDLINVDNQIISPATDQYIENSIDRAERDGAVCLIIQMDTPGGLLESARAIVKRMMNARVPIVVYVAPSGSRAASAGMFITMAAHVAAMAPSTNIGAAHPVVVGEDQNLFQKAVRQLQTPGPEAPTPGVKEPPASGSHPAASEEFENPMAAKILNDTLAWITGIATARGRNVDWARRAVTESVSATETEAVRDGVVDLIAANVPDLLNKINGRTVRIESRDVELKTAGAAVVEIPMSTRQRILSVIANPNVSYILMMLGVIGLIFEITHPGVIFPGVAGLVCLLLALYSFQTLPVSYAALAILLVGMALLVAEIKVMSHGLLALGGIVCLALGSIMLFESPYRDVSVSFGVILPTVATLSGVTLLLVQRVTRSQLSRVATGSQGLIGEMGEASSDLTPEGLVFVHGETWSATGLRPAKRGEPVRVAKVEGLRLVVEPLESQEKERKP